MGEVYRGRDYHGLDTRLDRTVAIKILPSHLSTNPQAKERFEREAKSISAQQHANIIISLTHWIRPGRTGRQGLVHKD